MHISVFLSMRKSYDFSTIPVSPPDFNKIEKFWSRLKHYLRTTLSEFESLQLALDNAFKYVS